MFLLLNIWRSPPEFVITLSVPAKQRFLSLHLSTVSSVRLIRSCTSPSKPHKAVRGYCLIITTGCCSKKKIFWVKKAHCVDGTNIVAKLLSGSIFFNKFSFLFGSKQWWMFSAEEEDSSASCRICPFIFTYSVKSESFEQLIKTQVHQVC